MIGAIIFAIGSTIMLMFWLKAMNEIERKAKRTEELFWEQENKTREYNKERSLMERIGGT